MQNVKKCLIWGQNGKLRHFFKKSWENGERDNISEREREMGGLRNKSGRVLPTALCLKFKVMIFSVDASTDLLLRKVGGGPECLPKIFFLPFSR